MPLLVLVIEVFKTYEERASHIHLFPRLFQEAQCLLGIAAIVAYLTIQFKMLLITQDSPVYTPVTYGTQWYTEIVDAVVTTTASTHVGSIFLLPVIEEIKILASDNGAHSNYVSTEIRNSTDNHLMSSFEITFGTTSSATGVINIQPGVINNWYDIYLSASTNPGTASLEGIYVEYKI